MLRRLLAAAILCCCLLPATAMGSGSDVIHDCVFNGRMTKKYTQKEYRDALAEMPTDAAQYYGCPDMIKRAQQQAASSGGKDDNSSSGGTGGSGGGGGGGGGAGGTGNGASTGAAVSTAPTAAEQTQAQADIQAAQQDGAARKLAEFDVRPGALAYHDFGSVSNLPTPLIVLCLLLLAAAVSTGGYLLRDRARSRGAGT